MAGPPRPKTISKPAGSSPKRPTSVSKKPSVPEKPREVSKKTVAPVEPKVVSPEIGGVVRGTAALRAPDTYTPEDLELPNRALLARTVGAEERLAQEDLWWKNTYTPFESDTELPSELWGTRGDKDFFYYGGAPQEIDEMKGWARAATPEEKERDAALLKERGLDRAPPELAWKDTASRDAAMKMRMSAGALREDADQADSFVTTRSKVLEEEVALRKEISDAMNAVLLKYSEGEKVPESVEEQVALLQRIQADGSEDEKEIIEHGQAYFNTTQDLLEQRLAEFQEGSQILEQIQKSGWIKSRRKMEETEKGKILAGVRSGASYEDLAQRAVDTHLILEGSGRLIPEGSRIGSDVVIVDGEPRTNVSSLKIESLGIDLVGAEAGKPLSVRETPLYGRADVDFQQLAQDPAAYQAAIEQAAHDLDPDLVQGLIEHKRALGILRTFETGREGEAILQGQRIVTGTPRVSQKAAEAWAREVVFYREVQQHTQRRVSADLQAAADEAGLSLEAMAQVSLSRKLYGSGSDSTKTAFSYGPTLEAIQDRQADIVAQSYGFQDLQDAANQMQDVEWLSGGDLSKLQYTYTDADGNEVDAGSPPSRGNVNISDYFREIAMVRAKTIIREDLSAGRGMVFVKSMTSEERAAQARASGVPFLYMLAVPRSEGKSLEISSTGEVLTSGEFFEDYSVLDHTMQIFNGVIAYGGAVGKETLRSGVIDDVSMFMTTDSGDFNWSGLGLHQQHEHLVRNGETLEDIASYYFGSSDALAAQDWLRRERERLGLGEDEQPTRGSSVSVTRSGADVLGKFSAVAMGAVEDSQLWAEMDRRWDITATEQMLDLAEWSAEGIDVWGDPDLATKTAALGILYAPLGVYLDIRAPDPFTGTLLVGGKSIQAWKGYHQARQTKKTISELRSVTDEATSFDGLMKALEEINPGADVYFQARVAHAMGVDENVAKQLRSIENQLERERLLLRKAEVDAEDLKLEVDKANAQARIDATRERIAALEHQSFTQQKEIFKGQIDALEKRGARKALKRYKEDMAASQAAKHHEELAHQELKGFQEGTEHSAYKKGLENHRENLQTTTGNQVRAQEAKKEVARNIRVVSDDLRVQKRVLDAQLREMKAAQRQELKALDDDFAAKSKPMPNAEWVARARRAGLDVDMRLPPDNLKSWKASVRRAEKDKGVKGHLDGDPATIKGLKKELGKAASDRRKEIAALKKTKKEALKKRHSREKALVEEELKVIRDDLSALTWTKRSSKARPEGSPEIERLRSSRDTVANRLTDAVSATQRARERSKSFLKNSSDTVKKHRVKTQKATRATKAHARLAGKAWARLAAFAPGLTMGAVSKSDAIEVIENTLADLQRAERAMDNEIAEVKKRYKGLLQSRRDAKMSAKEANKQLDRLVRTQDRQARLTANTRGFEAQQEVWRNIALKMADEIEQGNPLLKAFPDESPRYYDPLAKGTVKVDAKSGERVIDTKKLRQGLDEKYGSDAIEHFIRSEPGMSRPLKDLLRKSGEVTVSGAEVSTLQQLQAGLLRAREAVHPQAEAINTVRAIAQAKGDVDMMRVAMSSSNRWQRVGGFARGFFGFNPDWWPTHLTSISRALSPIKNKVGPISGEQIKVLKAADLGAAMINEDMKLIAREAHGNVLPGGADGVAMELFSAEKRVENSKKAAGLYLDLVDGKVTVVSTRPLRQPERPELIAALETEIKGLSESIEEVERKLKVEREIPGETLLREELETTAREMIEKKDILKDLQAKERALIERVEVFRRELFLEADAIRAEAASLEAAGLATDADHVVFTHYKAALEAREAGDMGVFERKMLSAAEASGKFSKEELGAFKDRLRRSSSTQAQETVSQKIPPFEKWVEAHLKPRKEGVAYWDDMDEAAKVAFRSQREAEVDALFDMDYPLKAKFTGEDVTVLGPQATFHPPKPDGSIRKTQWLRIRRPDGSTADTLATSILVDGKPLVAKGPPARVAKEPTVGFGSTMGRLRKRYDALVARRAKDPDVLFQGAGEAGEAVATQAMASRQSRIFSTADETVLRNAAGEAEKRLFEPDRLRAQADEILEGLDQGNHPRQDVFDDLRRRKQDATSERTLAEQDLAGTEARLGQLKQEHLPEDLQRTLTGRQQVGRLQHELKQAEAQLALHDSDMRGKVAELNALVRQQEDKVADLADALKSAESEGSAFMAEYRNAELSGDEAAIEEALLAIKESDQKIDLLRKEQKSFAPENRSNPIAAQEQKLREQLDSLQDDIIFPLETLIEDTLRPAYDAAIKEHGWTSGTTSAEHALRAEKKALLQKKANVEAVLKENSAKPSWREVEDFLSTSEQGERLGSLHASVIHAETRMAAERKSFEALPGEQEFIEQMLQLAINEKRSDLAAALQKALPRAGGKPLSVAERMVNARGVAKLLEERPLLDSLVETSRKLNTAEAAGYGVAIDRLAKAETEHARAVMAHKEARAAYDARRKALLEGDESLPLGSRDYSALVTKKNIPIPVAGRTTASNTGLTVPWDDAVHQWKSTDLAGLDAKIGAAAKSPGHFGSVLKSQGVSESLMGVSRMWVPRKHLLKQHHQSKLLRDAAKILNRQDVHTFKDFSERMRDATFRTLEDAAGISEEHMKRLAAQSAILENEHSIAMGAYNVMRASLLKRTNDNIVRTIGATFTDSQARAINALLGAEKGIRSVPEGAWNDVIEGMNRLGTPLTQAYVRPSKASGLGETTTRLVAHGATDAGATIWAREDLIQAIDSVFADATKHADRFHRVDITEGLPVEKVRKGLQRAYSLWKQSVTSGLILPNPGYWMNNVIGDFSQMYFTVGLGTATKLSTNNLPTNIPVMGKYWNDWAASMAKGTEKVPVLGTLTNALFNPHLAKIWNRRPGHVVFKGGQTASYEDLYRWSVEDGILDSVIQQEFLASIDRVSTKGVSSAFDAAGRTLGNWQEDILLFADFAQKRQRMGLYVELLKQGKTREEAARLTLEALYDWRHSLAKWEVTYIVSVSPFWRFWKNALKQVSRVVTDPLTKPDKVLDELLASGLGGAPAGAGAGQRIRQAMQLEEHGPELLYETVTGDDEETMVSVEQGIKDAEIAARHLMPKYLYDYMYYSSGVISPERRAWFGAEQTGILGGGYTDAAGVRHGIAPGKSKFPDSGNYDANYAYTHSFTTGPKWSTVEAMGLWANSLAWFTAGGYAAQQHVVEADEDVISDDFIEDFLLKPALKLGGPPSQFVVESLAEKLGGWETDFSISGRFQHYNGRSSLNPGEADFLSTMKTKVWPLSVLGADIVPESVSKDDDVVVEMTGRYHTDDRLAVYIMRNMPLLMQLPTKVNQAYYQNPAVQEGLWPALLGAAMQTGALPMRTKYSDPLYTITSQQWDVADALKETLVEHEDAAKEKTFAAEHAGKAKIREENIDIIEGRKSTPTAPPPPEDFLDVFSSGEE